jgi:hypothetical protein
MVFCNTLDSCRATEHFLAEAGLPTLSYHGELVSLSSRREVDLDALHINTQPSCHACSQGMCHSMAAARQLRSLQRAVGTVSNSRC